MLRKSNRGLWLSATQPSGKLREPWTVETEPLERELERRRAASRRYFKDVRRYGPTSVVSLRNEQMIFHIVLVLKLRDGLDALPF